MDLNYGRKYSLTLSGNELTGDTFACKSFIKDHLAGKWDGGRKCWTVDVDKVNYWISKDVLLVVNKPAAVQIGDHRHGSNGWCPVCRDWTYGDCGHN